MIRKIVIAILLSIFSITQSYSQDNALFGDSAIHIIFPCNKITLNKNQESWVKLDSILRNIYNDTTIILESLRMYGAASPEGPYNNNVWLSKNRLRVVVEELEKSFPDISSIIESYNTPEDYERLVFVTQNDSLYKNIANYITSDDAITKKQLQADQNVWKDLLKRYYPGLRAVNIIICTKKKIVKKIIIVPEIPQIPLEIDYIKPNKTIKPIAREYCSRQPMVRLKTNLIYDAGVVPNLALEFLPKSGHFTGECKILWSGWRNDDAYKTWIIHAYEGGLRYYFNDENAYRGWFVNADVGIGIYDIQLSKNRGFLSKKYAYNNKSEIGVGYVWNLGRNWTLEALLSIGCIYSKHDNYHGAEDWATSGEFYYDWHLQPEDFVKYNHRFKWLGPTNVGISISYDILHYKKKCVTYY